MKLILLGIDFPHARGEFCRKITPPFYTLCRFATPFLYWKDGRLVRGEKGDFLINRPGQVVYHGPCPEAERGFVNDWMYISGEEMEQLLKDYPLPVGEAFRAGQSVAFRDAINKLAEEFRASRRGRDRMIDSLITGMMINLHRGYMENEADTDSHASVAAVRAAIRQNPERKWSLAEMAETSGYSVSRFSELYRGRYGISPQNDVLRQRLQMAKQLLASGQSSVTHVAQACGFGTVNYFSKYFKKAEGCTPSEFMRRRQGILE